MTTAAPSSWRAGSCGQPDRPCARDIDGRAGLDPGAHRSVEPGREDVRQHGQVSYLLHRLVPVGEAQQVEIGVGRHDVLRLAAYPATHVDIAVGGSRAVRVDVEADPGLALFAIAASATSDVERHRAEVADLDEFHVRAGLDDLAENLMAEDQARRRRRTAADHVLVATADVRRDDLQDHAVVAFAPDVRRVDARPVLQLQLRVGDLVDLDLAWRDVSHGPIA